MNSPADASAGPEPSPLVTSVYLWGGDRGQLNATARVLARRLDPEYHWVEALEPVVARYDGPVGPRFEVKAGAQDLAVRPGVTSERLWAYLRPRGQHRAVEELRDFLRLPDPLQSAVVSLLDSKRSGPRVLVFANIDLVSALDRASRAFVGRMIEFLNSHDITLLVTAAGRPLLERVDFEYSLTLADSLPERFRTGAAVCQWGDCDTCLVRRFPRDELVCILSLAQTLGLGPAAGPLVGVASH
jgi:hypothetical protein